MGWNVFWLTRGLTDPGKKCGGEKTVRLARMALNAQAREESFIILGEVSLEACERIHSRLPGAAVGLFSHGWDGLEPGTWGPQSRLFWEFQGEVMR